MPWKPDFTRDDPWEGMPADYAGIATFVSVPAVPLPPWEETAPEYIPTYGSPKYVEMARQIVEESQRVAMTSKDKEEVERARLIINSSQRANTALAEFNATSPYATTSSEITGKPQLSIAENVSMPWFMVALFAIGIVLVLLVRR